MRKRQVAKRYEAWSVERAAAILLDQGSGEGRLLPMLHALQEAFGYVPAEAVPMLAEPLNLSRAEVHGSITFYHDFRARAARAATCSSSAGPRPARRWAPPRLHAHVKRRLGIDWHGTTATARSRWSRSSASACAPAARRPCSTTSRVGRLDAAALDAHLAELRA